MMELERELDRIRMGRDWMEKPLKCPVCGSTNVYRVVGTNIFICKNCHAGLEWDGKKETLRLRSG